MTDFLPSIAKHYPLLRPYQQQDASTLLDWGGRGLLLHEAGVGKTPIALTIVDYMRLGRVLTVTPASVVYKWQEEYLRWTKYSATVLNGEIAPHTIVSWNQLAANVERLSRYPWQLVIIDEAHRMGNLRNQWTKAVREIGFQASRVLFLTGDLIINHADECWPILNLLAPRDFPSLRNFQTAFDYTKYMPTVSSSDPRIFERQKQQARQRMMEQLAMRIRPFMLRRTKSDPEVARYLPELDPVKVSLTLQPAFRSEYKQARLDLIGWLKQNGLPTTGAQRAAALVRMNVMRQILGRAKVKTVVELAQDLLDADPSNKVVIFSIHEQPHHMLMNGLRRQGVLQIVGDTPNRQRQERVKEFQTNSLYRVMLISKAGEEGIDLYRANYVIFNELPWNPKGMNQVIGRIHRVGQTRNTTALIPVVGGTIDQRIYDLIQQKRELIAGVIGSDESIIREIARQELEDE